MKQQAILYGIIGLLVGSLLTVFLTQTAVSTNNLGMMRMMGLSRMDTNREYRMEQLDRYEDEKDELESGSVGMGMSMRGMMNSMDGKTGDSFDKAFLQAMIVHHEGAIEMAKEAKVKGQHPEVKSMADDIIMAQTTEVEQMKKWIAEWGL